MIFFLTLYWKYWFKLIPHILRQFVDILFHWQLFQVNFSTANQRKIKELHEQQEQLDKEREILNNNRMEWVRREITCFYIRVDDDKDEKTVSVSHFAAISVQAGFGLYQSLWEEERHHEVAAGRVESQCKAQTPTRGRREALPEVREWWMTLKPSRDTHGVTSA